MVTTSTVAMFVLTSTNAFALGPFIIVVAAAGLLGGTASHPSRSQVLIDDQAYMKRMNATHHRPLASERADIGDVRIRELAGGSIKAQWKGDQGDGLARQGRRAERPGHDRGGG